MAYGQMSLFDGSKDFVINKPIRLIELFAGYGSQHFALKYLGLNVESYKICEWAVKSIQAYKDAHFSNDNTDYSKGLSYSQIVQYLLEKGISANYNEPMLIDQIKRMGEQKCRQVYNNIKATHNLVNIQQVKGEDLEIADVDKYTYIMTYSFPCQDLSMAGLREGMAKGSGTRSGMLWEVERILDEIFSADKTKLPQVLLMENVPEVIGSANISHFADWLKKLEELGYRNYKQILNSKDYGIPQNRARCFMVSLLGDYYYGFSRPIKLNNKLKDILEENVPEKYYLSEKALKGSLNTNFACSKLENKLPKDGIIPTLCARDYKDSKCVMVEIPKVNINGKDYNVTKNCENYIEWHQKGLLDMETRAWKDDKIAPTLHTNCGKTKILESQNLKTKLCNDLIASGKVKEGDVIRHSYSSSRMKNFYVSNSENPDCSPTLDTRCDCLGVVVKVNSNNKRLQDLVSKTQFGDDTLALDCYNQVTHKDFMQTIKTSIDTSNMNMIYTDYRIRKLTPRECFRLMGVKDEDFDKIAQNQSNASLYHLAGDSIVVNVLMAIFKQMLKGENNENNKITN